MRLIDADEYEKRIKPYDTEDDMDKALYNFAHYHLVTTPSAQPSYTDEQIQKMQELEHAEIEKAFQLGMESAQPEPIRLRLDHELSKEEYERLKKDCAEQPIILLPKESAQQWIPCSERLPEDMEEVNVTWVNHNPVSYYNFIKDKPFTATAVYYKEKWYWYTSTCVDLLAEYGRNPNQEIDDDIEITAWMPLPEPYVERRTDD